MSYFSMSQKNTFRILAAIPIVGLLFFGFTNCGQPGELELKSESVMGAMSEEDILNIISNCNQALVSGTLKTVQRTVNFEDTRVESGRNQICEFAPSGQQTASGNLDMKEGQMRARYEQARNLNLPANAVICDVEMKTNLQKFRYDDVFFFTLNGFVLATNNKSALMARLTPEPLHLASMNKTVNFYRYNWLALRTGKFENVADDFCLGKGENLSTCSWPVSEQQGQIKFDFAPELLIRATAAVPAQSQAFGFVITGDNDPQLDCYHEKVEFDMTVRYYTN